MYPVKTSISENIALSIIHCASTMIFMRLSILTCWGNILSSSLSSLNSSTRSSILIAILCTCIWCPFSIVRSFFLWTRVFLRFEDTFLDSYEAGGFCCFDGVFEPFDLEFYFFSGENLRRRFLRFDGPCSLDYCIGMRSLRIKISIFSYDSLGRSISTLSMMRIKF